MEIQSHCKSQAEFSSIFMELITPNRWRGLKKWRINLEEGKIAWQRQFDWQFIVYLN